jgi:hypothetical protein|tara:strand:- start:793 stop:1077 length:285 start_codon:yes stop_codon:yes gene_type:complete
MVDINDGTSITIPIRNLIALIAGTAVAVTGYFHMDERLTILEHDQIMFSKDVNANSQWITDWEKEGLLPADIIQNNKLEFLESRVLKMENILEK